MSNPRFTEGTIVYYQNPLGFEDKLCILGLSTKYNPKRTYYLFYSYTIEDLQEGEISYIDEHYELERR